MPTDWIRLELGQEWGDGTGYVFIRISEIRTVSTANVEGESIIGVGEDAYDVKGTPEEIMEMINARTKS